MGDRANIIVKHGNEQVVLYTHWSGDVLPEILADALERGRDSWSDFQYLTRIIFSEMIQGDVDGTTGYGITQTVWDTGAESNDITVNVSEAIIKWGGETFSFEEYIQCIRNKQDLEWNADQEGHVYINKETKLVYFADGRQLTFEEFSNYLNDDE